MMDPAKSIGASRRRPKRVANEKEKLISETDAASAGDGGRGSDEPVIGRPEHYAAVARQLWNYHAALESGIAATALVEGLGP